MLHLDYNWDLDTNGIILDDELNTDRLGWRHGDIFEFVNINGKQILRRMDPVVAFSKGRRVNFNGANNG